MEVECHCTSKRKYQEGENQMPGLGCSEFGLVTELFVLPWWVHVKSIRGFTPDGMLWKHTNGGAGGGVQI
ncbi:hypothetical protein NPIL_166231 [Nephila pilipes]|uniref:Uncharacterized protein n=1 Tax=Nephila pilipes TaxID=299642 RepID=A0A8X6PXG5_NEPPI|nr:hypothetical protein NPIL_166231 [Nephila pilipes]